MKKIPHSLARWSVALVLAVPAAHGDPVLELEVGTGDPATLFWDTDFGPSYYLYGSGNMVDWAYVEGFPQAGTGAPMEHLFTPAARSGFFLLVEAPPAPAGFRLIPPGPFEMGNAMDVNEGLDDELPVHGVGLAAYYLAEHEVTKALWDEVRTWGLGNGYPDLPAGNGKGAGHPVHSLTWHDVVKWCNARSEKEALDPCYRVAGAVYKAGASDTVTCDFSPGMGYRLPTEAEWEKAARGWSAGKRFPDGDTISHDQANYYASTSHGYDLGPTDGFHPTYDDGVPPYTAPAGTFAPNGYGLQDMAGNLFEWCWDWYSADYYAVSPVNDPRGPTAGPCRVFRGGGWNGFGYSRAAYRGLSFPSIKFYDLGFRLARTATP